MGIGPAGFMTTVEEKDRMVELRFSRLIQLPVTKRKGKRGARKEGKVAVAAPVSADMELEDYRK